MDNQEYSTGDYRAPISDMLFSLRHTTDIHRLGNWDNALASEILQHAAKFVEQVIAPAEPGLDGQPPVLKDGRVKVAPALVKIVKEFTDGGWTGLSIPEQYGGQGMPTVLSNVLFEMISGASLNATMSLLCVFSSTKLVLAEGSSEQKSTYIPGLLSGEYNATIVLSEPQAGSDLRLVRTSAKPAKDGKWLVEGGKVFCSGADHDLNPNILHCILARTEGAPKGVKGLSLFLCPAVKENGERNAISVIRVEKKMGLHASPTCQVNFDGAEAEIVGEPGEGLKRMFTMMNAMRMDVATQGVGLCQISLQRSMAYAADRIQGRSLSSGAANFDAVPINQHGDIKRMLLTQDALAKGSRSMIYRTAVEQEFDPHSKLAHFMMPVCKVFASDSANIAADMAIQIHGGYGYVSDYQVEQIARDARIGRIYEGANGLHATNLCTSLKKEIGREAANAFVEDVNSAISSSTREMGEALTEALLLWKQSRDHVAKMNDPGMIAYDFMKMSGLLAFAAAWARLECSADQAENTQHIKSLAAHVRQRMLPETKFFHDQIKSI